MQSRDKIICAAMTLAIIAFMVLSPGYIAAHRRNLTQQYRQQSTESYQGIISLWHIVGFKSYQGSMGAWLEKAAATLEKKHKGVYFEVESMTFSDYEARRERGEKADMYSFPLGYADYNSRRLKEMPASGWRVISFIVRLQNSFCPALSSCPYISNADLAAPMSIGRCSSGSDTLSAA